MAITGRAPIGTMLDTRSRLVRPSIGMWECIACGTQDRSRKQPLPCLCGVEDSWLALEPPGGAPALEQTPRARLVTDLDARTALARVSTGSDELDALTGGGWPLAHAIVVYGPAGGGKSRLCYRWASLAGGALVVGLEMAQAQVLETADSAGAELGRFYYTSSLDGWQREAERLSVPAVVFDSASKAPWPGALGEASHRFAHDARRLVFLIAHVNKRGRVRGTTELEHNVDAAVSVVSEGQGRARVSIPKKSRFCATGAAYASVPIVR